MANVIVALDGLSEKKANETVDELSAVGVSWFKVGLELFTKAGPVFVTKLKSSNHRVFLDLKLHDIPNTVEKAAATAAEMGADLITIHAAGGAKMIAGALKGCAGSTTQVVAVTVLTSIGSSDLGEPRTEAVRRLAQISADAGTDGIVCSAADLEHVPALRTMKWKGPGVFVTPGIRNAGDAAFDQSAIATPELAVRVGSTHLVVGRPILNPSKGTSQEAARRILALVKGSS